MGETECGGEAGTLYYLHSVINPNCSKNKSLFEKEKKVGRGEANEKGDCEKFRSCMINAKVKTHSNMCLPGSC